MNGHRHENCEIRSLCRDDVGNVIVEFDRDGVRDVELATSFFRPDVAGIVCEQFRTLEDQLRASVSLNERRAAARSFRVIDGGKESA